jgi:hypothetical protein
MSCRLCQSNNQSAFDSEICIHFPGRNNLTTPAVLVFPTLIACLDCGFTELQIEEAKLLQLAAGTDKRLSKRADRDAS